MFLICVFNLLSIVLLGAQRPFDQVQWSYMMYVLKKVGFGPVYKMDRNNLFALLIRTSPVP